MPQHVVQGDAASGDLTGTYPSPTLAPVVTPATVGSATQVPVITYDAKGRIIATTVATIAAGGGTGTVTSTSVVPANGLSGTVATPTTTPAITLSTTVTGIVKGNGTALAAAVSGTDYALPNANTTGTASTITGTITESQVTSLVTDLAATEKTANKNAANGYAGLDGTGKVAVAQLPATVLGALEYQGVYDASTGVYPASPSKGFYYVVSVAGTISGTSYKIGDWLSYDGTTWDKIDNSQTVSSVAGKIGAVLLVEADVANLTSDLASKQPTITLTTTGTTGAATLAGATLNIPNYATGGGTYTAGTGLTLAANAFSLTTPVSLGNGGTGSTTQNFVDLATAQTIAGVKTFSSAIAVGSGGTGVATITGLVKGNGVTAFTAAVSGTDYALPNANTTGTASNVTGIVALANGGTGSTTQNFVDLTTAQTVAGAKTFSNAITSSAGVIVAGVSSKLQFDNGATIQWKDTGGVYRDAFYVDGANNYSSRNANASGNAYYGLSNASNNSAVYLQIAGANTAYLIAAKMFVPGIQVGTVATSGQVLTTDASGNGTWQTPTTGATYTAGTGLTLAANAFSLTTPVTLANGGTGSTTQNFIDLTTAQTVAGVKTFSSTISGSVTGNAATVTTNANLTGDVTSVGNVTTYNNSLPVAKGGTGATTSTGTGSNVLSVSPTFTGTVTMPAPVNATDASTKGYVDATAQGLSVKLSVYVVATTQITFSAPQTIDGVALVAGNRVLLTGQTTTSQNGIWVVQAAAWTRPTDFATGSTQQGAFVFVEAGTANTSSGWVLAGTTAITVDTTAETWTQFSGAGEILAGTGITKAGNTLSLTVPVAVTSGGTGTTTSTGTGSAVLSTSPTLVTPALGTPSAIVLTSATGLPLTTGVTGTLPVANGGTGSATQNFIDLTTNQTATGTKTLVVQDKGGQVFSVMAYGATGNGTTDDTAAVQAAATAAVGATLYFPVGTFLCSSTITLAVGTHVLFAGRNAVLKYTGATDAMKASELKGLVIDGGGTIDISTAGTNAIGIHLAGIWFADIRDMKIIQGPANSVGIYIETSAVGGHNFGSYVININNIDLWNGAGAAGVMTVRTPGDGIPSPKKNTHIHFINGWCSNKTNGLYLSQVSSFWIDGFVVDTGTNGIYLEYADNIIMRPGEIGPVSNYAITFGDLKLATALVSGTTYTSLAVSTIGKTISSGDTFQIGTGATTQTVTASAAAAVDSTSVAVTSFVANAAYAVGTYVINTANATNQGNILIAPSYAGGGGTNGYLDTSFHQPAVYDRSSVVLKAAAGIENYKASMVSNYNYGESFDLTATGGGTTQKLLKWGDAAGLTLHGGTGGVNVDQNLVLFNATTAANLIVKSTAGTNKVSVYHTGTNGTIESSTGFVLAADNGTVAMTGGSVNPIARVQNVTVGVNFNSVTIHNDDNNGFIATTSNGGGTNGDLNMIPGRNLVLSPLGTITASKALATSVSSTTPAIDVTQAGTGLGIRVNSGGFVTNALQLTGGTPAAGKVLVSDATGNGTWQVAAGGTGYITSITTTGTSGAATVTSGVLNVPQYAGGGTGISRNISTITTAVTTGAISSTDYVVFINTGGIPTLPTAVSNTNRYTYKNITTGNITPATTLSQTIDGGAPVPIPPGASIDLISDSANWRVV